MEDSPRVYKSGNPFKRPCPLTPITTTRAELEALTEFYAEHGAKDIVKPDGKGPKGKLTAAQSTQYKKAIKGKEDEGKLAEKLRELVPLIEKEEAVCLTFGGEDWLTSSESKEPKRGSSKLRTSPIWLNGGARGRGDRRERLIIRMAPRTR